MDFVEDYEERYNKTNEHFKDKAKKECRWQRFAGSSNLSVKVSKTWFESQRTLYLKLTKLPRPGSKGNDRNSGQS